MPNAASHPNTGMPQPEFCPDMKPLQAMAGVFVEAYNRFGAAKHDYRLRKAKDGFPFAFANSF